LWRFRLSIELDRDVASSLEALERRLFFCDVFVFDVFCFDAVAVAVDVVDFFDFDVEPTGRPLLEIKMR
jgi:hypothetical protein